MARYTSTSNTAASTYARKCTPSSSTHTRQFRQSYLIHDIENDAGLLKDFSLPRFILSMGQYPRQAADAAYSDAYSQRTHITISLPLPTVQDLDDFPKTNPIQCDLLTDPEGLLRQIYLYTHHPSAMKYGKQSDSSLALAKAIMMDFLTVAHCVEARGKPPTESVGIYSVQAISAAPGEAAGSGHAGLTHWLGGIRARDRANVNQDEGSRITADTLPAAFKLHFGYVGVDLQSIQVRDGRSWVSEDVGAMNSLAIRKSC
jgi:hypothetical protein